MVDLIPGTTLPITTPGQAMQPEGRDFVQITKDRAPVSMLEKLSTRDDVSPAELMYLDAAIRHFNARPRQQRTMFVPSQGQTDATTGNAVLQLFECPQGGEAWLGSVTVDVPNSAAITATAPYANASSWAFLAVAPPTSSNDKAFALSLRTGAVAFAPTSAGGPILPGQWVFGKESAPVAFGGEAFYFVLIGGSIATLQNITVTAKSRVVLISGQGSS